MLFFLVAVGEIAAAQQSFGAEQPLKNRTTIPTSVLSDLRKEIDLKSAGCTHSKLGEALEAANVNLGSQNKTILLKPAPGAWCLCGAYLCPAWIYELTSSGSKQIWRADGMSIVNILEKKNDGVRQIQSVGGSAGHGFEALWKWDGEKYKSAGDKYWSSRP